MSRRLNSLNPMDRRKQRIDDLAASAAGPRPSDRDPEPGTVIVVDDAGTVDEAPGVSLIASAWRRLRRDPVFLVGAAITLVFILLAIISPWLAPHDPAAGPAARQGAPAVEPDPGPRARLPARRRRQGPRPALAPASSAASRPSSSASRPRVIGLIGGLVLGILAGAFGGGDRRLRHARRRRAAVDPVAAARRVDRGAGPRAQPVDGHHRHRRRADPGLRPAAARLDAGPALERPRAGRPGPRRDAERRSSSGTWCPTRSGRSSCRPPWCSPRRSSTPRRCPSSAWATPTTTHPSGARCSAGSQAYIYDNPHLAIYPALCIILVALGFTLMGESLREALDPKSRR